MLIPLNSKIGACFTLEGTPGNSFSTRRMSYQQVNYDGKFVLNSPITEDELTVNNLSNYRSIWKKVTEVLNNRVFKSIDNDEQMLFRHLSDLQLSSNINHDGGYFPFEFTGLFTRGYNNTTPVGQYGYSPESGYFSNIYSTDESQPFTESIDPILSGSIFVSNPTDTIVRLYFTSAGSGQVDYYDYIFYQDNLKLRLNMGSNYITNEESVNLSNGQQEEVITKFLNIFGGKVLKVYDPINNQHEEMLITGIGTQGINVNQNIQLCPHDLGVMPNNILLEVVRGYNNTTPISMIQNTVTISKPGFNTYGNFILNAYVEGNPEFTEVVNEDVSSGNTIAQLGGFTEILSQNLGVNLNSLNFSTIKEFVEENIIFTNVLQEITVREFLIMINDLIVLSNNSSNKIEYTNLIGDLIRVFDQSNLIDFVDFYANVQEFLQMKITNSTIDSVAQVFTVIINDYFRLIGSNVSAFSEYFSRSVEFIKLSNTLGISGNLLVQVSDNFRLINTLNSNINIKIILEEILKSTFIIEIDGEQYECYALNLDNKALTRYTNYNFNSFAHFNNKYYALSSDGLYDLIYTGEDGEELQSKIKTSFLNISDNGINTLGGLGSLQKSLKTGYFLVKNDGQIGLRIYTDLGGKFDYILKQGYNDSKFRTTFGSAVKGTMFQLELTVFDDFELEQCELIPIIQSKKV